MNFLLTICMTAVAAALFRMLVPDGKLTKQVSLLIVCVFLLSGINALSGAELCLDEESLELSQSTELVRFSGDVNTALQKKICSDMSDRLYKLLAEREIYPKQIHVNVNISGLYSISIEQVKLVFDRGEEQTAEKAYSLVREELPDEIEVVTGFMSR